LTINRQTLEVPHGLAGLLLEGLDALLAAVGVLLVHVGSPDGVIGVLEVGLCGGAGNGDQTLLGGVGVGAGARGLDRGGLGGGCVKARGEGLDGDLWVLVGEATVGADEEGSSGARGVDGAGPLVLGGLGPWRPQDVQWAGLEDMLMYVGVWLE